MPYSSVPFAGSAPQFTGSLFAWFAARANQAPDAVALMAPGRVPLTYSGLLRQITAGAAALNGLGIGREDRVAVVLPNGPEMAVMFLTAAAAATCAPLNPAGTAGEIAEHLSQLNARALVVRAGEESAARAAARAQGVPVVELAPMDECEAGVFRLYGREPASRVPPQFGGLDDVALILPTSGTTSRPKMVPLTQRNLCCSAEQIRASLTLDERDRCLNIMPLFHIHGLVGALLATLAAGGSVVCPPGFHAPRYFRWVEQFRPTWYTAVPTMHQAILDRARAQGETAAATHGEGAWPLRFIRSCSSPLPPAVMAELESAFGVPVIEAYGMTEAAHQIASNPLPPGRRRPGSVGVAAGSEVAILGEDGRHLPAGERGEIVVRGPNVMGGYCNNPEANASSFSHGWFRTGDEGYLDSAGYLFITGRLKEMINRGGEKISPREVEEALLAHPAVAQVVAFAAPHRRLGEEVAAAVVLREGRSATVRELRELVAGCLAPHKVPRRLLLVAEIPKGPTGKPQRIGLAARLGLTLLDSEPDGEAAYAPPCTAVEAVLAALWAEVLELQQVGVCSSFVHLGGDSVMASQIAVRVRELLQVELPPLILLEEAVTVADLAAELLQRAETPRRLERRAELLLQVAGLSEQQVEEVSQERAGTRRDV